MSDTEKTSPEPTPERRGHAPSRFGIGVNVFFQVLLCVAIFAGVNRLSYRHYTRIDLSPQQSFTLSSLTLNFISKLSKDVYIDIVFPRDSKIYGELTTLLEEYRLSGNSRIRVKSIDPLRDISRAEELKANTGLTLSQSGVLVRCSGRSRFLVEDELVVKSSGTEGERRVTAFRGEDAVTSALISVVEGDAKVFYLVVGKGGRDELAMTETMEALDEMGKQQNFAVELINLAQHSEIPADADGLLLLGPRYDLSKRETDMLRRYWDGKRAGIFVMLEPSGTTPNMEGFMAENGVRPRFDRVMMARSTSAGIVKEYSVQAAFSWDVPMTRPLADSTTTLSGQTRSLELLNDDSRLRETSTAVTPLMQAAENFWGETEYLELLPVADENDALPPVYVAASVEKGSVLDERLRVDSCRMVVVGNSTLLDKQTQLEVNRDFVAGAMNWIINREKLAGVPPRAKKSYRIQLNERQHRLIFWLATLALPGSVLALGMMVWASRRAS